ncbi:hypothetical protein K7640_13025 [Micromonospora sp. PLK6-60]|uniref:hypothetical protein n=1 Tax=Micromonospora sp. PLK6-60 TaxID=2873383 RepID=UPI001CA754CB|nr:hypothetical protein [Micromonospora sp. PLK6-60]MBY8872757.1 hypothetical protein [Micromonospora sp. PLK6-60]
MTRPGEPSAVLAGSAPRRRRPRLLTVATLAGAVAVGAVAARTAARAPVGDPTVGEVTRVGVVAGGSVPDYLRAAAAELAALGGTEEAYALVSLTGYRPPGSLAPALAGVSVAEVVARVPLPDRQTEIVRIPVQLVPEHVRAGMTEVAGRKDREAADQRARAAALTDATDRDGELRRRYDSGARVAAAEAAAYRSGCACVYAALVRADPPALRALAARPGVRVVDPAPELRRLDRSVLTPPLPEQRDTARPPADREPGRPTPGASPDVIGSSRSPEGATEGANSGGSPGPPR